MRGTFDGGQRPLIPQFGQQFAADAEHLFEDDSEVELCTGSGHRSAMLLSSAECPRRRGDCEGRLSPGYGGFKGRSGRITCCRNWVPAWTPCCGRQIARE